jgi:hypothetical protein
LNGKESLTKQYGLSKAAEKRILQLHRLVAFEDAFTGYLEGRVTAAQVKERAQKMLEIGLSSRLK